MNFVKSVLIGVVILSSTCNLYADESKKLLIIEYLELSKTKEVFDMTIDAYAQQLSSQNPDADKEKIRAFFNTYMGWDALKEPTIKIVESSLTAQELKDINRFYKTKSGRSLAEKSPKMSADISNIIGANLQKAMQNMSKK